MPSLASLTINSFPKDDHIWRLTWLAGLEFNPQIQSELLVNVVLERLPTNAGNSPTESHNDTQKTPIYRIYQVGVGALPILTIGTLWKNGRQQTPPIYKLKRFKNLWYSKQTMQFMRAGSKIGDREYLIPPFVHALEVPSARKTWVLTLRRGSDPFAIIIPAMEIARFFYCNSTLTAQTILTKGCPKCLDRFIDEKLSGIDDQDACRIALQPGMIDADLRLCAALKTSSYACKATDFIYRSFLESHYKDGVGFPKAFPPFSGEGRLTLRGIPFNSGGRQRFLAYKIISSNFPLPVSNIIQIEKQWPEKEQPENATDRRKIQRDRKIPALKSDQINLVQHEEPDISSSRLYRLQDETRFLDHIPVEIISEEMSPTHTKVVIQNNDEMTTQLSTGQGTWGNTQSAGITFGGRPDKHENQPERVRHPAVPATFENFIDKLEALRRNHNTEWRIVVGSNEYVPHETGNRSLFPTFNRGEKLPWAYLDKITGSRRQVLIAKIAFQDKAFYLLEFQRRPESKERFAMPMVWPKESFHDNEFRFLNKILMAYAEQCGRPLSNSVPYCGEKRFRHNFKSIDSFAFAVDRFLKNWAEN